MSCYEWERGTLKLPTAAWKPFRDGMAAAYNQHQLHRYELALKVRTVLLAQKAIAKRGSFVPRTAFDALYTTNRALSAELVAYEIDDAYSLDGILFDKATGALLTPKKKDFPLVLATKATSYNSQDAFVGLEPATRQVTWSVSENNHAVDRARESWLGRMFFGILSKVVWTRATGGVIVGNNEYRRDDESEGGGGNVVNDRFGPLGVDSRPFMRVSRRPAAKSARAMSCTTPMGGRSRTK